MKRHIKLSIILVALMCAGVGFRYHQTHTTEAVIARFHDRSHDTALINRTNGKLDTELLSTNKSLSPQFALLGMSPQKPEHKSICYEGDPELYKYICYTTSTLDPSNSNAPAVSTAVAAQRLISFDAYVTARGWSIFGNDFRAHAPQPASQWQASIAAYSSGVDVSYERGDCTMEFSLSAQSNPGGTITCSDTLLPGQYY